MKTVSIKLGNRFYKASFKPTDSESRNTILLNNAFLSIANEYYQGNSYQEFWNILETIKLNAKIR